MSQNFAHVTTQPINEAEVRAAVDAAECGAVVTFCGVIRDHDGGSEVRSLDYSAHPEAERFMRDILADERAVSGLRVAAIHRIGSLEIGDIALVAAVSAAHRGEAFAAIERLVERIKHEVPIWKRQHFASGSSEWVGL